MNLLCRYVWEPNRKCEEFILFVLTNIKRVYQLAHSLRSISLRWKFMFGIDNQLDQFISTRWQRNNYCIGIYWILKFKMKLICERRWHLWKVIDRQRKYSCFVVTCCLCRITNEYFHLVTVGHNVFRAMWAWSVFENDQINGIFKDSYRVRMRTRHHKDKLTIEAMGRLIGAAVKHTSTDLNIFST